MKLVDVFEFQSLNFNQLILRSAALVSCRPRTSGRQADLERPGGCRDNTSEWAEDGGDLKTHTGSGRELVGGPGVWAVSCRGVVRTSKFGSKKPRPQNPGGFQSLITRRGTWLASETGRGWIRPGCCYDCALLIRAPMPPSPS